MTTDYGDKYSPLIAERKMKRYHGNVEKALRDLDGYVAKLRTSFGVPFDDETQITDIRRYEGAANILRRDHLVPVAVEPHPLDDPAPR